MTTRQKLELPINQPITIELLFDDCVTGTSKYGNYFFYSVKVDGEEFSFFPPVEVHDQLKLMHKGDRAIVTKLAVQRGTKVATAFEVRPENKVPPQPSREAVETKDNKAIEDAEVDKITDDALAESADDYFQVMLSCYNDAFRLQKELNGMIDIERAAITLFISRTKR
ncbi:MAG: hypothetical protein ABR980_08775 [Ignavibacteriaceae bacterium]|jgi:hypothetical protein